VYSFPQFWWMLLFGLLVGAVGFVGLNSCMLHLNPLVYSTVMLSDPAITGTDTAQATLVFSLFQCD
jgi:hypothetical protein